MTSSQFRHASYSPPQFFRCLREITAPLTWQNQEATQNRLLEKCDLIVGQLDEILAEVSKELVPSGSTPQFGLQLKQYINDHIDSRLMYLRNQYYGVTDLRSGTPQRFAQLFEMGKAINSLQESDLPATPVGTENESIKQMVSFIAQYEAFERRLMIEHSALISNFIRHFTDVGHFEVAEFHHEIEKNLSEFRLLSSFSDSTLIEGWQSTIGIFISNVSAAFPTMRTLKGSLNHFRGIAEIVTCGSYRPADYYEELTHYIELLDKIASSKTWNPCQLPLKPAAPGHSVMMTQTLADYFECAQSRVEFLDKVLDETRELLLTSALTTPLTEFDNSAAELVVCAGGYEVTNGFNFFITKGTTEDTRTTQAAFGEMGIVIVNSKELRIIQIQGARPIPIEDRSHLRRLVDDVLSDVVPIEMMPEYVQSHKWSILSPEIALQVIRESKDAYSKKFGQWLSQPNNSNIEDMHALLKSEQYSLVDERTNLHGKASKAAMRESLCGFFPHQIVFLTVIKWAQEKGFQFIHGVKPEDQVAFASYFAAQKKPIPEHNIYSSSYDALGFTTPDDSNNPWRTCDLTAISENLLTPHGLRLFAQNTRNKNVKRYSDDQLIVFCDQLKSTVTSLAKRM